VIDLFLVPTPVRRVTIIHEQIFSSEFIRRVLMRISLRAATLNDLDLLQHWDKQPHVIASDPDEEWNWETELDRNPLWREQLVAELDGRPIALVQIIDPALEETHYWGEVSENLRAIDIWIGEPDCLGQGFGTQIMKLAIERCFAVPEVSAILIDPLVSNQRAIRFYERMGFRFVEHRRFGESDCAVFRMDRTV
jgi:aminoglycoside 6'-N-acetyltransferase